MISFSQVFLDLVINVSYLDPLNLTEYNSTVEKERLQNVMTFGSDRAPETRQIQSEDYKVDEEEVDRFDEVLREIEERQQFLDEMAALGQDKPHRNRVMTEISQVNTFKEITFIKKTLRDKNFYYRISLISLFNNNKLYFCVILENKGA